jgi:two-component system nitrate/nitrite response regulator NarL
MRRPPHSVAVPPREEVARALIATDVHIVASASQGDDHTRTSVPQDQPVLLIIDASDEANDVVSRIKFFRKRYPRGRVVVLADRCCRSGLISAYRAGANAYFKKDVSCGDFIKNLELIMLGETILPSELFPFILGRHDDDENTRTNAAQPSGIEDGPRSLGTPLGFGGDALRSLGPDTIPRLSTRERCILRYLVEGCSNKLIARQIDIAEATVKVHVKAILRKIRVSNRTQAAIWAANNGSLVWDASADSPSNGNNGYAAIGSRGSYLFDPVADVNGAKLDGALKLSAPCENKNHK